MTDLREKIAVLVRAAANCGARSWREAVNDDWRGYKTNPPFTCHDHGEEWVEVPIRCKVKGGGTVSVAERWRSGMLMWSLLGWVGT